MDHTGLAGREMAKMMEIDIRNKFFISLVLTIPIVTFTYISLPFKREWLLFALTTPVYFYCGWIFLYSSYLAIKQKTLNMAVLIAVGITAAYLFSIIFTLMGSTETFYEASAMLTTFVLFGHWMEMKSRRGTTDALQALFNLVPPQARVIRNGKEEIISTSEVKVGDIILIKPGDKIPVDGKITEGESAIDESLVTGESIPVSKTVGDLVIGGSINTSGSIKFMATKIGEDTALAQIVKMVETAQNSKAPGQKIADRFAKYLVIVAVGGGLITFVVWFFVLGQPLMLALTFAISTVVIACPDALGLATPTAVAVGTGLGAKHNILIKDAPTLEQVSKIQAIVLDKTGTLTEGKPKITDIIVINNFKEDEILELAGSVEAKSGHPLSKAILEKIEENKLKLQEVSKFNSISGHGVEAIVNNQNVLIGTIKLMNDRKMDIKPIQKETEKLLSDGKTIMLIAVDNKIAGVIAVQDLVKQTSKMAVEKMQELGLEVAMITGDNKKTAEIIGKNLGIERVFSEVLPVEKEQYVKKMQDEGKFTAMVGDGVNDAPALARANIGIAIGAGTDVAIETANVVLMKSDPMDILRAIILSKATVRKMKENLVWASIYNLLAIPIAAGVLYPSFGITLRPEFSALLMSVSSIIVAVNAVSLKRVEVKLNI
jgi:Cu2+-exporting ATPase